MNISSNILTINILSLSISHWLLIILILLISTILSRFLAYLAQRFITHFFNRLGFNDSQKKKIDQLSITRSVSLIIVGWLCLLGFSFLDLSENVINILVVASKVMTYFGIVWTGWRISDLLQLFLTQKAAKTATKFDDLLAPLVCRTLKVIFSIIGILSIAEILKLPLASLLAGLGIGGIAIAMAAKDTISNIFGSLTVVVDRPFNIGDWVKIGDVEGTVVHLGFRSTRVRTFYDSLVSVPNSILLTAVVDNMGERAFRRYKCYLDVVYDTTPEKLESFCEGIRELIQQHPKMRNDNVHIYLNQFGPSSLQILVYCFFKVNDWSEELNARHQFNLAIIRLAKELKVEFAYPTQSLYINKPSSTDHPLASEGMVQESIKTAQQTAQNLSSYF
ncbi:hypothetical protein DID75_04535 [Candidatus Marinamargulisbacteria bacterium SCGC AG-410-N11]|nr:hypothetical protein DID75_04535 [Candidatus Marinamargulisbacteria bacterium SCGC AG-410-N11]